MNNTADEVQQRVLEVLAKRLRKRLIGVEVQVCCDCVGLNSLRVRVRSCHGVKFITLACFRRGFQEVLSCRSCGKRGRSVDFSLSDPCCLDKAERVLVDYYRLTPRSFLAAEGSF